MQIDARDLVGSLEEESRGLKHQIAFPPKSMSISVVSADCEYGLSANSARAMKRTGVEWATLVDSAALLADLPGFTTHLT